MSLRPNEVLIGEHNFAEHVFAVVDGENKAKGLVPRDYSRFPQGCYGAAPAWSVDMPLIPRSEWSERIKDMEATKSRLSDIRLSGNNGQSIPSLDQNGRGYCWFHSGTSCVLLLRAVANMPYVSLSAYAGACIIKNYRDEGGWGAQGLDFLMTRGVPSDAFWPQRSVSRSNDTPACWENAKLHRVTEGFIDLQAAQYDRNLTWDQVMTCLLSRIPIIGDHNWWAHSIAHMDPVDGVSSRGMTRMGSGKLATVQEFDQIWSMNDVGAGYGVRIWNSWGDSWSDRGMGVLAGNKAIPDGATAPRATFPSIV